MLKSLLTFTSILLTTNVMANAEVICNKDNTGSCAITLASPTFKDLTCPDETPEYKEFTVTNNTPNPVKIYCDVIDAPQKGAVIQIKEGTCGTFIPPGDSTIEVAVQPVCSAINPGGTLKIDAQLVVEPDVNQSDLFGPIRLNITNPDPDLGFIALAAGYSNVSLDKNTGDSLYPYYVVYDVNGNWTTTTLPDEGSLQTAACSGEGQDATCFVAGSISSPEKNAATSEAFAYVSTDGGVDWAETAAVEGTNVVDITCTDDANLCELIAENASSSSTGDVIYRTTNKGQTWTPKYADDDSRLLSIDCDGSICAAGGILTFNNNPNRLFIFDFGSSSTYVVANGTNKATACYDSGTNKICFFGGYVEQSDPSIEATKVPSLYYVKPEDGNPTAVDLTELVNSGSIDAIDCSLLGGKVACFAGGEGTLYTNPDVFTNPAGGWTAFISSDIQVIESISCASNGFCATAGQNTDGEATIIAAGVIINAGSGIFNSISCTAIGVNSSDEVVSCIASGTKTEEDQPLVWINKSVIATPDAWAAAPVQLTRSGAMNATGAASGD